MQGAVKRAATPGWLRLKIRQPAMLHAANQGLACPCVCLQGALYRAKAAGKSGSGAVALVLGAGNQLPVVVLDILHKLVGGPPPACPACLLLPAPACSCLLLRA